MPVGIDPGWDNAAADRTGVLQALTARLQRMTRPGRGLLSAQRDLLVRRMIQDCLASPAFASFVRRGRPRPRRRRRDRDRRYGRKDRAAPIALLRGDLRMLMGRGSPVVELTDWAAGKQYWRHGEGMLALQRNRGREVDDAQVPVSWYAEIQEMIDEATPKRASKKKKANRWVFRRGGRVLVLERRDDGILEVLAYYPRRDQR